MFVNADTSTGAIESSYEPNDLVYESLAQHSNTQYVELPHEVDLRSFAQPRNQGDRGICVAITGAIISEISESLALDKKLRDAPNLTNKSDTLVKGRSRSNSAPPSNSVSSPALITYSVRVPDRISTKMSAEFLYYHRDNKPSHGMSGRNMFRILQTLGIPLEKYYPTIDHEPDVAPTPEVYENARKYRIASFAVVRTIIGLKSAIVEFGPCYIMLPLYSTRPEFWRPAVNENPRRHSVAVVGYNDNGFILMNSWGPAWNGDGCIVFPYEDWPLHIECFVPVLKREISVPSSPRTPTIDNPTRIDKIYESNVQCYDVEDDMRTVSLSDDDSSQKSKNSNGRHKCVLL